MIKVLRPPCLAHLSYRDYSNKSSPNLVDECTIGLSILQSIVVIPSAAYGISNRQSYRCHAWTECHRYSLSIWRRAGCALSLAQPCSNRAFFLVGMSLYGLISKLLLGNRCCVTAAHDQNTPTKPFYRFPSLFRLHLYFSACEPCLWIRLARIRPMIRYPATLSRSWYLHQLKPSHRVFAHIHS